MKYSDASFSVSVSGATSISEFEIPKGADLYNLILNAGVSQVLLQTKDNSGNNAGCSFSIEVKDNERPVAKCKNIVVDMHPSGLVSYIIDPEKIDNGSTDNCKIKKKTTIPATLDCTSAGSDVSVKLFVEDEYGNVDSCTSVIKVKVAEIKPTFSAGLCTSDTLKLFSNVHSCIYPRHIFIPMGWSGSKDFL